MYKNKIYKKGIVFAVIVLFLGAGVVSSINVNETFNSQLNQNHIGLDSAVKVADAKLIQLDKSVFSIINYVETTDDDGTILFYVFNLQPQGYIVVSADYNLPPIIAYSFTSTFGSVDADNVLLQILTVDIMLRLENIQIVSDDIIEDRMALWNSILNDESDLLLNINFQQWPSEELTLGDG